MIQAQILNKVQHFKNERTRAKESLPASRKTIKWSLIRIQTTLLKFWVHCFASCKTYVDWATTFPFQAQAYHFLATKRACYVEIPTQSVFGSKRRKRESRSTYCTDFIVRPFATKSLNKPPLRRPVPVRLHVVISDNTTQNIWTELCTKYYTIIKTHLHGSDKVRIKFYILLTVHLVTDSC